MRQSAHPHIDISGLPDFTSQALRNEAGQMFRISFLFLPALFLSALMAAQIFALSQASAQQGHDACARDVSRFCRAHMNDGDSVVLACLKQHRARISRGCDKVLTENGQ
jgi:hypothetical protein